MNSFPLSFYNRSINDPNQILFTIIKNDGEFDISNNQLIQGGRKFAALYLKNGASAGDVILISMKLDQNLYFAFIGALIIGCIPSMMPFPSVKQHADLFWGSHIELFKHLNGGIIVSNIENMDAIISNTPHGLMKVLIPPEKNDHLYEGHIFEWDKDQICCLQHSSGTTGLKKGVTLTPSAIEIQVTNYSKAIKLEKQDKIVSWLPLYHDMGFITTLILPLITGNHTILMDPFDWLSRPLYLFNLINQFNAQYVWLPNFAFNHLSRSAVDVEPIQLSSIKAFINCSEPCKTSSFQIFLDQFKSWGVKENQLHTCYAMAETVFAISQTDLNTYPTSIRIPKSALEEQRIIPRENEETQEVISVGRPINDIDVRIDGDILGEILVHGPFVFDGYYKKINQDLFKNNYYKTGDIGFLHNGELYVLGRKKDLIIVLGKNFFAHEIETIINSIEGVKKGRVVAFGIYNSEIGSEEVIVIAEYEENSIQVNLRLIIKTLLLNQIGLNPKKVVIVEPGWIIKSTSGKISRNENLKKYIESAV